MYRNESNLVFQLVVSKPYNTTWPILPPTETVHSSWLIKQSLFYQMENQLIERFQLPKPMLVNPINLLRSWHTSFGAAWDTQQNQTYIYGQAGQRHVNYLLAQEITI